MITKNIFQNNKKIYLKTISTTSGASFALIIILLILLNLLILSIINNNLEDRLYYLGFLLFIHLFSFSFGLFHLIAKIKEVIVLKNKDIGILKSLGATDVDIAEIFNSLNWRLSKIQSFATPVYGLFFLLLMFISFIISNPELQRKLFNLLPILISQHKIFIIINIIFFFILSFSYPLLLNYIAIKIQLKKILKNNPLKIVLKPQKH